MGIRAILFDYGMVLSGPADSDAHESMIGLTGLKKSHFDQLYWAWRHAYDAGLFDGVGYWDKFAQSAAIELDIRTVQELIEQDVRMWSNINQEVVEWAILFKEKGLKTGILSNICLELATSVERNLPWLKDFDHLFWSSRLRMAKPDPNLYKHVIEKLEVPPTEILFLDDREENVVAARAQGMRAIQFTTLEAVQRQIKSTGLSFDFHLN
ncbi:MAG TPA: HAD family phosphatase [Terracidiphilus sp.]|jgi:putative hydrolase of the HAD superfamily|nr:HAD family phosphatase [Terracidiphilus sp.]